MALTKDNGKPKAYYLLILAIIPFILGTLGYMVAGVKRVSDALYGAVALYGLNLTDDYSYNLWLEIARWCAPLVTAATILCIFQWIRKRIWYWWKCIAKDSVAVYCDDDTTVLFQKDVGKHAVYPQREVIPNAKSHIILLRTDEDSLRFYEQNKQKLAGKKIYIGLRELDYGLMRDKADVSFYDIDGAIARGLWKKIALWRSAKEEDHYTISMCGTGHLGRNVLEQALLMNLYASNQKITYNFIGDNDVWKCVHQDFQMENNDQIRFFHSDAEDICEVLKKSDYVIIAQESSIEQIQAITDICRKCKVYYYEPLTGEISKHLAFSNLNSYGRNEDIYTDENIRGNKLIQEAMQENYEYVKTYGNYEEGATPESEWHKLNGFLKWSNISSSDYGHIIRCLGSSRLEKELAELEHIRWCRFHYLNHWTYGKRNDKKRIHPCLVPFKDLDEKQQEKDLSTVQNFMKNNSELEK